MTTLTQWEYSDVSVDEFPRIPAGKRLIKIDDAWFDDDNKRYHMKITDIETKISEPCSYNMKTKDFSADNNYSLGSLRSLTKALYGPQQVGIVHPDDIKGGVVWADVVRNVSKTNPDNGRIYLNIYRYYSAEEHEVYAYGDIDQFALPDTPVTVPATEDAQ